MSASPTKRSLDLLRREGWMVQVVEFWSHKPAPHLARVGDVTVRLLDRRPGPPLWLRHKRHDFFGIADIFALHPEGRWLLVQATTTPNQASRVKKITGANSEAARALLRAGARIEVWGWKKYATAVERRFWRPTRTPITEEMLDPATSP